MCCWIPTIQAAADAPPPPMERSNITPCVNALLDGERIDNHNGLDKNAEGTLEVALKEEDKIYFNLVLKSYVGNNEPPLFLRFIKVDRLDIQQVLKYANIGDEIYIEPFDRGGFKCLPSHFVIT